MNPKTPNRSKPTPPPVVDDEDTDDELDTGPGPTAYQDLDESLDMNDFAAEHIAPPDAD